MAYIPHSIGQTTVQDVTGSTPARLYLGRNPWLGAYNFIVFVERRFYRPS